MESIRRTWTNGLVFDWLQNARTFPLLEHYVSLRWTRVVRDFENYKENITSIYDLFSLRKGKLGPTHLYIGGKQVEKNNVVT